MDETYVKAAGRWRVPVAGSRPVRQVIDVAVDETDLLGFVALAVNSAGACGETGMIAVDPALQIGPGLLGRDRRMSGAFLS